jgi:undecaprenyl pyrophosphate phosphatase UppP
MHKPPYAMFSRIVLQSLQYRQFQLGPWPQSSSTGHLIVVPEAIDVDSFDDSGVIYAVNKPAARGTNSAILASTAAFTPLKASAWMSAPSVMASSIGLAGIRLLPPIFSNNHVHTFCWYSPACDVFGRSVIIRVERFAVCLGCCQTDSQRTLSGA